MKNRVKVFIPIESAKRELDGKMLMAGKLAENGFDVYLGTKSGINREVLNSHGGIYLAKSISNDLLGFYEKLKQRNIKMLALDVEGGILTENIKLDLERMMQKEAFEYFDHFLAFGEKIKEEAVRLFDHVPSEKLSVTGEPRFELLKPQYSGYFKSKVIELKELYGDYLLINTSFGMANPHAGPEKYKEYILKTDDYSEELKEIYLLKTEEGKIVLNAFVDLVKKLALKLNANIVLRPHPSENVQFYKDHFEGLDNVHVANQGNVQPWILAAKMILHHDCTTAVESLIAGKPALAYVPHSNPLYTAWLPIEISEQHNEEGTLINRIFDLMERDDISPEISDEKADLLKSYVFNYGGDSVSRIIDVFNSYNAEKSKRCTRRALKLKLARIISVLKVKRAGRIYARSGRERFYKVDTNYSKTFLLSLFSTSGLRTKVLGSNVLRISR